jgi:hypothetical protein
VDLFGPPPEATGGREQGGHAIQGGPDVVLLKAWCIRRQVAWPTTWILGTVAKS